MPRVPLLRRLGDAQRHPAELIQLLLRNGPRDAPVRARPMRPAQVRPRLRLTATLQAAQPAAPEQRLTPGR
eukprot:1840592-Pyramimonas_sp.AAC.1